MKFLNFSQLTRLQLLDIALVLSLIPHLFTLRLPMLIYLCLATIFILKKRDSKPVLISFSLLGLVAITLSFFTEYNLSNFSRLLVYISVLVSLLSYAVIVQRLSRQINFYLLLSPALLMILSFFFFNSISMLFYALFTLFSFTFLLLYERMQSSFKNVLRINTLLYLFALPIVFVLFLVFPRVSYKNASFGFTHIEVKRTGHDGTMSIGSDALLVPSPRVVMEVSFEKRVPPNEALYFRGSVLYIKQKNTWVQRERQNTPYQAPLNTKNIIHYQIKLYPHQQNWLYMLDLPISKPLNSYTNTDFITKSKKKIFTPLDYKASSSLIYTSPIENTKTLNLALKVNKEENPKTYQALIKNINLDSPDEDKAKALMQFFSSLQLSYSLKPKKLDLNHAVDSFLWDTKVGYCVHFASSFALSARMIGIPSRIVTGYKADESNAINNYLLVKEADAHAWVELYIKGKGWLRFDPTYTAFSIISPDNINLSNTYTKDGQNFSKLEKIFKKINIYYLYTRYMINQWVLNYDRLTQIQLLKDLLSNSLFLLKFIASVSVFVLATFMLFIFFQRRHCEDALLCEIQVLLNILKKEGFVRQKGENLFDFFNKIEKNGGKYKQLREISKLYHQSKYAKEENLLFLREKILQFKSLKNG